METEHIIVVHETNFFKVGSYVQTRGSIPLFWDQKPSMKWAPSVKIGANAAQSLSAAKIHMSEQKQFYGKQVLCNLIDMKGSQ